MSAVASIEEALSRAGVTGATLAPAEARALDEDGFVILRGAMAPDELTRLRERFEASILAPDKWPAPREHGSRHAMLKDDAEVRRFCLSPRVLAAVFHALRGRFFLAEAQGRDPLRAGGYQNIHRDWPDDGQGPRMIAGLAFLDPFGPENGATRLIPGTHGEPGEMNDHAGYAERHPRQVVAEGEAGDILLFHGRLAHSGQRNVSGAPRRTLQIAYRSYSTLGMHRETRDLGALSELERYLMGATA